MYQYNLEQVAQFYRETIPTNHPFIADLVLNTARKPDGFGRAFADWKNQQKSQPIVLHSVATFDTMPSELNGTEHPITLASLADRPIHVGWNIEPQREGGKPTKVPHNPNKEKQRAKCGEGTNGDPSSWGTRAAAEKWAAKQPGRVEIHKRGIGIVLGKLDDELCLAGIDLDTCRNPETGEMTPWAQEILDKFPSYTEISPSQTGVKIFFLVRMEDKAELARYPKAYRKPGGGDHTPGVECYVGGRYFTITDQLYGNETALRVIPAETVRWLHNVAGPAIKGKASRGEKAGQREQYDANSNAPPWSPEAEARVRSALAAIPNDGNGLAYDDWLSVQMALQWTEWPCAEALADEFSQRCDRYNAEDQAYKWDSYKADRENGVTLGTIFKMAKEHGWIDPSEPPLYATVKGIKRIITTIEKMNQEYAYLNAPLTKNAFVLRRGEACTQE